MKILVLNSGSSSIKYKVFSVDDLQGLAKGVIERIGEKAGHVSHLDNASGEQISRQIRISDHRHGFAIMIELLSSTGAIRDMQEVFAIGHRVVHGGESFKNPAVIDQQVISAIRRLEPLAPLHNPANLSGIEIALEHAPGIPQVAVFDTAFHQSMPEEAFLYALPRELYKQLHVRRYGFHGTSHCFVSRQAAGFLGKKTGDINCITLHLGNGASGAAIKAGRCIDTSMGFTPLEGLIMGTRSGDIDPAIVLYLARTGGMDLDEIDNLLNHKSGLLGICGDNDMRTISARIGEGDRLASLAMDMFCHRLKKYVGAYVAILGVVDCLVFTGGIGENSPPVREGVCCGLEHLGMILDDSRNRHCSGTVSEISTDGSPVKLLVIRTDEELEIARQTLETVRNRH